MIANPMIPAPDNSVQEKRGYNRSISLPLIARDSSPPAFERETTTASGRRRHETVGAFPDTLVIKIGKNRGHSVFFSFCVASALFVAIIQTLYVSAVNVTSPQSMRGAAGSKVRGHASDTIPLPLPKEKISVVLMNYSRPRMIRESTAMKRLLEHPNVDEVLLLHSNPRTAFEFVHPKVKNIDAVPENDQIGLSLRFYFCQMAKNPWVLHLDDDTEFSDEALDELLVEYSRNPRRIVGRYGRSFIPGGSYNGYSSTSTSKSTEVVLTKLMLVERDMCTKFFEYAHVIFHDVVLISAEGPLWNGEDIFMSLVANHVYGVPSDGREFNNFAMDWLDVWAADESLKDYKNGKLDISGGYQGVRPWDFRWILSMWRRNQHYRYRGNLWRIAKERLAQLQDN